MRRKYIVIEDLVEGKGEPPHYAVIGMAVIDERTINAIDAIPLTKETYAALKEIVAKNIPEKKRYE